MAGIGDHGQLVGKPHFDPEISHVEAKEGENQDAKEGHVFGGPGRAGYPATAVFGAFGDSVGPCQKDALDGMEEDAGIECNRDHPDKGVFGHKCRVDIERFASIISQQLEVAGHMDDEE